MTDSHLLNSHPSVSSQTRRHSYLVISGVSPKTSVTRLFFIPSILFLLMMCLEVRSVPRRLFGRRLLSLGAVGGGERISYMKKPSSNKQPN